MTVWIGRTFDGATIGVYSSLETAKVRLSSDWDGYCLTFVGGICRIRQQPKIGECIGPIVETVILSEYPILD